MEELFGGGCRKVAAEKGGYRKKVVAEGVGQKKVTAAEIVEKANPKNCERGGAFGGGGAAVKRFWGRKKQEKKKQGRKRDLKRKREKTGGEGKRRKIRRRAELSLRGLVGKRHSLAGCLRGRIAVRFLAHLAGESYFKVRLLCILRQLLMVCFSTLFLLILG